MQLPPYIEQTPDGLMLRLSSHSLDKAACPKRFWMYRVARRAPAETRAALVQGIAGHGALARWRLGRPQADQDAYVDRVYAVHWPEMVRQRPDEYRTAAYLKDALVQYKAEHREIDDFVFEEVEREFDVSLGIVRSPFYGPVTVRWTGRRDAVGVNRLDGKRYVLDNKFVSRDEEAEMLAATNSGALLGYCHSWLAEHPDKPIAGAILRRVVIRKPTKAAPLNVGLPLDPPVAFGTERIAEWRTDTLALASELLARPADAAAWPQNHALCRSTWGVCDWISVCTLPPGDRRYKLDSEAFRDADERQDYDIEPAQLAPTAP